jgi:TPR repeat protein
MQLLGNVYLEGAKGVKPDAGKAELWLGRAAETGDTTAMTILGSAYVDGTPMRRNSAKGLRLLQRAASQSDDTARTKLGQIYLYGAEGVPPQPANGEKFLKAAAKNGHAGAKATLGRAYITGVVGKRRVAEGARLLFQAARAGHPTARYVLAEAFLRSQGLETANRSYAQDWLQTVVAGDSEVALAALTDMLREATAADPDLASRLRTDEEKQRGNSKSR